MRLSSLSIIHSVHFIYQSLFLLLYRFFPLSHTSPTLRSVLSGLNVVMPNMCTGVES